MPEPVVTVWRNLIPHTCALLYWGRKWRIHKGRPRRVQVWSAHSPVIGGEKLVIDTRPMEDPNGVCLFRCYHEDGSPIIVTRRSELPDA